MVLPINMIKYAQQDAEPQNKNKHLKKLLRGTVLPITMVKYAQKGAEPLKLL
jgi:hypothetical protein